MSVKNFKFVSPGVFVDEIDNSQVPREPGPIGPVVIGRAEKGPSLRPVEVTSFSDFVQKFGTPSAGDSGNDVWRTGNNKTACTYGMYAAQAYLKNNSPLTYVRLLGAQTTADGGPTATGGKAGWEQTNAWGLFIFESGSSGTALTGALGAIIYANSYASPGLSGTIAFASRGVDGYGNDVPTPIRPASTNDSGEVVFSGSQVLIGDTGTEFEFNLRMPGYSGSTQAAVLKTTLNFSENSPRYIRKVLNTNPQLMNSGITSGETRVNYFLGETFDRHVKANITGGTLNKTYAALVKLYSAGSSLNGATFYGSAQSAQTPWIVSCNLGSGQKNLLRFHALDVQGDWTNKNIKISIQDIKVSSNDTTDYGTFTVVVRSLSDSDNVVRVIEQFTNCNLNPNSLDYVARKVGDKYRQWSETERRYYETGDWDNRSDFIRVEAASDVDGGILNASYLPFGFKGVTKWADETFTSGSNGVGTANTGSWVTGSANNWTAPAKNPVPEYCIGANGWLILSGAAGTDVSCKLLYPAPELRVAAVSGNLSVKTDAYFGFQVWKTSGGTVFDTSTIDMLRPRGGIVGSMFAGASSGVRGTSTVFSLDDVSGSGVWAQGNYDAGTSLTRTNGRVSGVLDAGYDRFTVPMYGGFDGMDIGEMDSFANRNIGSADLTSYEFNSFHRALDSLADPEVVEMNLATIPGCTNSGLTSNLINICEDRADALAIIDLPDGLSPREEGTSVSRNNIASTITSAVSNLRARGLNSSYGCCFYPWVRARDTISGNMLWLPPSVAALGTFSSSQRKSQVWFAPAGFNRGGLTEGAAGIPVVDVAHQLRRKDRDDLYAANINPIAKFPAEGIVIFGQKTLQITPSALDRINVRRLMIFVKKRISQMAATILFDPNVPTTWARFKSRAGPFLEDVKTNFGLSDFKLVLDATSTTPDLIDRNILYAKIYLKPTRAIEFIAIDFNITRTGASFND